MFCFVKLYYSCLSRIVWNRIAPLAEIYNACISTSLMKSSSIEFQRRIWWNVWLFSIGPYRFGRRELLSYGYWPVTVSGLSKISCFTESMIEYASLWREMIKKWWQFLDLWCLYLITENRYLWRAMLQTKSRLEINS